MARDRRTRSSRLIMSETNDARIDQNSIQPRERAEAYSRLTAREQQVLALVAEGKSNKEIARALLISVSTAKYHVSSMLHKLGIESRVEAAVLWARLSADGSYEF